MENIVQYTESQLQSITYILKDSSKKIVSQDTSQVSMLSLIDEDKLCRFDTRKVRKNMESARFDEQDIASLQNWKRTLSNDRARPRYNQRRRDVVNLMRDREDLWEQIRILEEEITFWTSLLVVGKNI